MALTTPIADIGWHAAPFRLMGVDGRWHTLKDLSGARGTLIAFICNHCPYVKAVLPRLIRDAHELVPLGINTIAINANDDSSHPEDSFAHMQRIATEQDWPFHYLHDDTQQVARAYGAVCTPDFYGFDADGQLQYRGRIDASGREPGPEDAPRELFDAMRLIGLYGYGPGEQWASIGCSIKWREPQSATGREALQA